jgi:hypothetical protein
MTTSLLCGASMHGLSRLAKFLLAKFFLAGLSAHRAFRAGCRQHYRAVNPQRAASDDFPDARRP